MNGTQSNYVELANKYRPLLVLYPEIEKDSRRSDHYDPDWREKQQPHIDRDYHPRDIRLVLDNAWLPGKKQKPTREELLEAMSENKVDGKDLEYIKVTQFRVKECARYWELYAQEAHGELYPRKAYAHVVEGEGRYRGYLSIQYWLPYFYDDWANVHQMDWEMVSVILKDKIPYACVYNAHHGGHRQYWMNVDKVDDNIQSLGELLHPVVYVANGSHASYFFDDPRVRSTITDSLSGGLKEAVSNSEIAEGKLTDHIPSWEEGDKYFPEIEVIPEPDGNGKWSNEWRWLNFTGNWGAPPTTNKIIYWAKIVLHFVRVHITRRGGHLPIEQAGPIGPAEKGNCWKKPFEWINEDCYGPEKFLP